ncbi:hypothetical protein BO221_43915 [Archangium sp. Cb G35]|uniref:hypothetical protein n=1 Tax=Archangium sp. Cb G35 TaxID=1920190 RepID=UPI0009363A3B|nr:hypothetical protein [Archangium sp. Cb G35]OJT17939.1 hypothetical protein BO221_43915 [Archangium sp. Cb G35]
MRRQGSLLKLFVTGLLLLPLGVGCVTATPDPKKADAPFEMVKTDEFEGVIFPRETAPSWLTSTDEPAWTPTRKDVLDLEERIEAYLREREQGDLWSSIASYKRQYVGLTRNGRRVIFANFFCHTFDDFFDWRTRLVSVDDGGDCFFHVFYEPASATFSGLQINGEA